MNTDVALARRHHAALKDLFIHHSGGAADFRALRRVLALCQEAREAVDDAYCREKLQLVAEFAAEMLSHNEHGRWGRDSMSGADFLRRQVLNALELFASRIYSIEALESCAASGASPWKIRSNFAQT